MNKNALSNEKDRTQKWVHQLKLNISLNSEKAHRKLYHDVTSFFIMKEFNKM